MTDGIAHTSVRLIDDRGQWPDAAILAAAVRESLAAAYANISYSGTLIAQQAASSHFIQGSLIQPVVSTTPDPAGNWRTWIPIACTRIVAEVLVFGDIESDSVASLRLAVGGTSAPTIDTPIESGKAEFVRARAYWRPSDTPLVTLDNYLDVGLSFHVTQNNKATAVPARPLALTVWKEYV